MSGDGTSKQPNASDRQRLNEILAELMRAVDAGQSVEPDEWLTRYPDFAADLKEYFEKHARVERLVRPLRQAAAHVLHVRCPHCHHPIELLEDARLAEVSCPSCGSSFSLVGEKTISHYSPGEKTIGHFQLLDRVGIGAFGTVWKARDTQLDRTVAVKIPRNTQLDESQTELFLRDARAAAQLKHPNIVGVHEVGKQDDTIYIVSDFIQGATLKEWMDAKRLTPREAAELCVKVAMALHHAHESGVIHRDLKPGNIMMDTDGEPHIVDFGLAKREAGEITMTVEGQILGTPAYMSPEQARGEGHRVDRRADIYSLGVILFELLTGELPFRGDKQMLIVQILNDDPPGPRKLNNSIPCDLETICLKCLEKELCRRYDSAQFFADDCERFLKGVPVLARTVSRLARGWRWCRRNPLVAGLSTTIAALLVGIALVASAGYFRTQAALIISHERGETIERNLYYSEMNRAGAAAMNPDGLAQVRESLVKWLPQNNPVDRRGWEWYYLDSLLHQDVATLQAHEGAVFSVAWSPDGSRLASTSGWNVKIWGSDGQVVHTLTGHDGQINSVDWNKDGTLLASASYDGTVRIWDADRGETVTTLRHGGPVNAAAWSHDDQRLAVANLQNLDAANPTSMVTIWSSSAWEKELEFDTLTQIDHLSWNPVSSHIATISKSKNRQQVRIWDPATGEQTGEFKGKGFVAWNYDGTRLATGDHARINVWDLATHERTATFAAHGLGCAAWSPKGSLLAFAAGKVLKLYDVSTETEPLTLRGHLSRMTAVCWHPSGERTATSSTDGTVKIWSTIKRSRFSAGSYAISWNPDGSQYVSCVGTCVVICGPKASQAVKRLDGHADKVFTVSWSPDGASVASASLDGEVRMWDAATGELTCSVKTLVPDRRFASPLPAVLAWSPDSHRLAFPQADYAIGIVDAKTGEQIHNLKGHTAALKSLAWSPDGSRIVSGGYDGILRLWNPVTGQPEKTRNIRFNINAVCWNPDGSRIAGATATSNNDIYIWDSLVGPPLYRLSGHTTYVHTVSWSSDGQRIASADESGSIRIWDARTGQQTLELSYPRAAPLVAWNPDRKRLACVGFGGKATVRIWDATVERSEGGYW